MWRDSHLQLKNQEQTQTKAADAAKTDSSGATAAPAAQELSDTQKRGMKVIENTLKNKNLTESERASMLQAQQRAFGVSEAMVKSAQESGTKSSTIASTSTAQTSVQEMSDTQKRGMRAIQNTLKDTSLSDSERASMLQAQQKAFGVTDAMVQNAQNRPADSTAVSAASPLQEIGMKALMGTLSQNFANSNGNGKAADKSAVEDIVKTFGLTKDMVNQVAENFAKENEDRYLFAKQQLGTMMGFNTKA